MYYVYMLRTDRNTLYTGQTNNILKRLKEHQQKRGRGAKYTRSFKTVELVFIEQWQTINQALKREAQIKKLTKKKKELLIATSKKSVY